MDKVEFEQEVRRVLKAFGLDYQLAFDVCYDLITPTTDVDEIEGEPGNRFTTEAEGNTFILWIAYVGTETKDNAFGIGIRTADEMSKGVLRFVQTQSKQQVQSMNRHKPLIEHELLMMRGLFNLGYDIDPLCEQRGICITAHEKLEWFLEMQKKSA